MTRLISAALLVALVAAPAAAEPSRNVIAAFRGQLVVTKDELPEGKNDKDTIAKIKQARLSEVAGAPTSSDVTAWHFRYAAFLNKAGAKSLKLNFMIDKRLAADVRITDVDPKSALLTGEISVDEDEGLAKGKTYSVELVDDGNHVVSSAKLTMK